MGSARPPSASTPGSAFSGATSCRGGTRGSTFVRFAAWHATACCRATRRVSAPTSSIACSERASISRVVSELQPRQQRPHVRLHRGRPGTLHRRRELLRQLLAELHAPLVE